MSMNRSPSTQRPSKRPSGPRTRAVIAVHMWGTTCDMDAIMAIARRRKLLVIEDTCQGVGGGYKGRKLGTIGDIGAYSFNFYKNMSAGEGGGVVTNDEAVAKRVNCAIDPCHAFWTGRNEDSQPFAGNGARASEFMGAILNVQLDRIDGVIEAMRRERDAILAGIGPAVSMGLRLAPLNSKEHDCATNVFLTLPSTQAAETFVYDLSERHCGQDRPPYLYRVGPGSHGRRCRASIDESLQHAGQCGVPQNLLAGHVRQVARHSQ